MANVPDRSQDRSAPLSWVDSWEGCTQCGSKDDLMAAFTTHGVCGDCARKNQRQATRRR